MAELFTISAGSGRDAHVKFSCLPLLGTPVQLSSAEMYCVIRLSGSVVETLRLQITQGHFFSHASSI